MLRNRRTARLSRLRVTVLQPFRDRQTQAQHVCSGSVGAPCTQLASQQDPEGRLGNKCKLAVATMEDVMAAPAPLNAKVKSLMLAQGCMRRLP